MAGLIPRRSWTIGNVDRPKAGAGAEEQEGDGDGHAGAKGEVAPIA